MRKEFAGLVAAHNRMKEELAGIDAAFETACLAAGDVYNNVVDAANTARRIAQIDAHGTRDRAVAALQANHTPVKTSGPQLITATYRHEANEWADMAVNGLQWLRSIRDGRSLASHAVKNMEACLLHCQEVSKAAAVAQEEASKPLPVRL